MCGRFTQGPKIKKYAGKADLKPRYNIAPSQEAVVILRGESSPSPAFLRWGLVPSWAKDPAIGNRMINARSETLSDKPSFRVPFKKQRCLVPADGFYEWKKEGKHKIPHYIRSASGEPFSFAGLWAHWRGPDGVEIRSFTIITTAANAMMLPIHERMPAILSADAEDAWLDPNRKEPGELVPLLSPCPSEFLRAYPVSPYVNSPANDGPECIEPLPAENP